MDGTGMAFLRLCNLGPARVYSLPRPGKIRSQDAEQLQSRNSAPIHSAFVGFLS